VPSLLPALALRYTASMPLNAAAGALALAIGQAGGPVFTADVEPPPGLLELGDATVELREAPTLAAEVTATITRASADTVQLVRVRIVTRGAGRVRASAEATVTGTDFGAIRHLVVRPPPAQRSVIEVQLQSGQAIELLQETERGCFASIDDRVLDLVPCPAEDARFDVEARPRVEWWGLLRLSDGRSGWTLIARHGPPGL
jgi:hypothetical protein